MTRDPGSSPRESPGGLRVVSFIALAFGAVGSDTMMLYAFRRNPSRILLLFFVVWVLSPFAVLLLANKFSKRWPGITRTTLYGLMLVVTLGSLAVYGYRILNPPKATGGFVFIVLPPLSWLLIALVLAIAALVSRRLSRARSGT